MAGKKAVAIPEPPAKVSWNEADVPGLVDIKRSAVGTAYAFKERPGVYHLRVKAGTNSWLQLSDRTVAKVIAEWKALLVTPPSGSGYFTSDAQVQREVAQFSDELKRLDR